MGVWSAPEPAAEGSLDVGLVVTPAYCPCPDGGPHALTMLISQGAQKRKQEP